MSTNWIENNIKEYLKNHDIENERECIELISKYGGRAIKLLPEEVLIKYPKACIEAVKGILNNDKYKAEGIVNVIPKEIIEANREMFDEFFTEIFEKTGYNLSCIPYWEAVANPEKYREAFIDEDGIELENRDGMFEIVGVGFDETIKSNGNVKLIEYDENYDEYNLKPTIRKGEIIPILRSEILVDGEPIISVSNEDSIIEEIDNCKNDEDMITVLEEHGLLEKGHQGQEVEVVIGGPKIRMVYNTAFKPETNRKLLDAYASDSEKGCYNIENFIFYHISDLQQCLGGIEGVREFAEEWFEYNYDSRYDGIEEFFDDIEKAAKDVELSEKIEESKELDGKIGQAEELLSEYQKQDPEQNKEEQTQGDN